MLFCVALTAAMFALLSGCGFHLRGDVALPSSMEPLSIQADVRSGLGRELRRALRQSQVRLASTTKTAGAVLLLEREQTGRRVLSVDAGGKVREYELSHTAVFRVRRPDGSELVPEQTLTVVRDYRFDPSEALSKAGEQEVLRREMERALAQAILRRLRYGGIGGEPVSETRP